ncbi:ribokinase [Alicyclobacillus cellulosilyticus]|uniref:Ribokinase n=1 Tax=Alicyclobacillus cellulosilyticus TaxID=1003997 RepID=A0A917KAX1_9BACL|nr:ribokinase [Alicyclobacillus cellulosilyticus]GGJ03537.1 ribokinase [Alicyclobacillus cellulosilyticus]
MANVGMANVMVIGSINMDVVNRVHRHPRPGETVHGLGTSYHPGGKGANQAVAAARADARVTMVGAVGTDGFGDELITNLQRAGVDTAAVLRKEGTSGLAFIDVDDAGENLIILSAGANGKLSPSDLVAARPLFAGADIVLLQNEIPWETTRAAIAAAHDAGVRVCLNPAPAFAVPADVLPLLHLLAVNETEAEAVSGVKVTDDARAAEAAAQLVAAGAEAVLLTLGGDGVLYRDRGGRSIRLPAYPVDVVDTTGAGDTFIGAFAAEWVRTGDVAAALHFAAAAAAISVTRPGAQASIPARAEIEAFLAVQRGGRT